MTALDRTTPPRPFHSGELVFSQAQPASALFILKAGRICIFSVAEDGKTLTIAILEIGAGFGRDAPGGPTNVAIALVVDNADDNYAAYTGGLIMQV